MKERVSIIQQSGNDRLFNVSTHCFLQQLREDATALGYVDAHRLGSHAFRRGMARDIIDKGGSLAMLMRAGEWRSSAYIAYLREHQAEDACVANLLIDHSDSD